MAQAGFFDLDNRYESIQQAELFSESSGSVHSLGNDST
jgi:hypothetical protein